MDIIEITTMLGTLVGIITPLGGVGLWMYRKQARRLKDAEVALSEANVEKAKMEAKADEWHIWKEQNDALNALNASLIERNKKLVEMNAEKEDRHQQDSKEKEERFANQTTFLRNTQRELRDALSKQIELTRENGELKEENAYLRQWLCEDANCDHGIPPRERLRGKCFGNRDSGLKTCPDECRGEGCADG